MEETTARGQVSRRTIAKGMAWAAPAIPVVAMAPKAAASPGCVPTLTFSSDSCKCPGTGQNNWDYFLKVCYTGTVCPDTADGIYVAIRLNTGPPPGELVAGPVFVPANGCSDLIQFNSTNSANFLNLHYGATPGEASDPEAPFIQVANPPNCDEGDLGTCGV
jgi:hypothetical protein